MTYTLHFLSEVEEDVIRGQCSVIPPSGNAIDAIPLESFIVAVTVFDKMYQM